MNTLLSQTFKIYYDGAIANLALPDDLREKLERELSYENSSVSYQQKQRPWMKAESATRCLYSNNQMPAGLIDRAAAFLGKFGHKVELIPQIAFPVTPSLIAPTYPDWLRAYQLKALQAALDYPRGILQLPTGSGKTITAAHFLLNFPTANILFTVPRINLAYQTQKVLKEILGEEIGLIGDSKRDWQRVTVGVINSLALVAEKTPKDLAKIQITIHDECHYTGSDIYWQVTQALINQSYCMGLSATAWRGDGADLRLEGICGPLRYLVTENAVANCGGILLPTYIQIQAPNRYTQEKKRELILHSHPTDSEIKKAYDYCIVHNKARNDLIAQILKYLVDSKTRQGGILVLVNYLEHGDNLIKACAPLGIVPPFLHGKSKKREETIEALNNGEIPLLIGSRILKDGQDIPNLEYLVLAESNGNKAEHYQKVGRVLRNSKSFNKKKAYVIDIADTDAFFSKRTRKRVTYTIDRYVGGPFSYVQTLPELQNELLQPG